MRHYWRSNRAGEFGSFSLSLSFSLTTAEDGAFKRRGRQEIFARGPGVFRFLFISVFKGGLFVIPCFLLRLSFEVLLFLFEILLPFSSFFRLVNGGRDVCMNL
jgi:hypothetical protein